MENAERKLGEGLAFLKLLLGLRIVLKVQFSLHGGKAGNLDVLTEVDEVGIKTFQHLRYHFFLETLKKDLVGDKTQRSIDEGDALDECEEEI